MNTIYKYDSKGKLREWKMEVSGDRYRTISGLADGQQVVTSWTTAKPKNTGRANATSAVQQALSEVESAYAHKLAREYHTSIEAAKGGAHFTKPMLAEKYSGFPLWEPSFMQPKLDGMRCLASAAGLFSRQGKPILSCPHISAALAPVFAKYPDLILDGELYNHDLKDDFPRLMSLCRKGKPEAEDLAETAKLVQYHVYDIVDLTGAKFSERLKTLDLVFDRAWLPGIEEVTTVSLTDVQQYNQLHGRAIAQGYEGSMLRLDKPYEQTRSRSLLKRKDFLDDEFEVVRLEEGQGNWGGVIKSVVCRAKNGKEFGSGLKGTKEYAASLMGKTFKTATIRYFELTPDGVPRFGICTDLHTGDRND